MIAGYEADGAGKWTRTVEFDTANPATYEAQITEADGAFSLMCFRITADDKAIPLNDKPLTGESAIGLDLIATIRIEHAEESRKAKHTQRNGKIVTTKAGRKVRIGRA